jgi:hypothetical protein
VRAKRIAARRTASLARRLGLDANPLRRGTDRAGAWIRIGLVLAFLIGAPLIAWGCGHWAGSVAAGAVQAQRAGQHRVTAVLLRSLPRDSAYPYPTEVSLGWVMARWTVPGGSVRTGYVQAPFGSRAGSTVRVWLDRSGRPAPPLLLRSQVQGWVFMMAVLAPVVLALLLLAVAGFLDRILERRRLAGWEHAWSVIEPQWTRRLR